MVVRECPVNDTRDIESMIDKYIAFTDGGEGSSA